MVIKAIQGAFSFSSGHRKPVGSACVPEHDFYMEQGAVFVEFLSSTPTPWLKLAQKHHLVSGGTEDSSEDLLNYKRWTENSSEVDLLNYRRLYLYKRILQIEREQYSIIWHQLCLLKQGQLNNAIQLLRIDSTLGMRAILGRDDIHAEWVGEAIQFWTCRNVTPSVIHLNGCVNNTCYQYTPVQLDPNGPLLFVSPGSRDLVDSSPVQECGHASAHLFKGDDGNWYSAHGLVHVTELPLEVHWKGLWDAFTFNAPSLFHNQLSRFVSSFYQPRYHSHRIYKLEQTLEHLVNYTASMSLDPSVVGNAIRGMGEGFGAVLSGAGSAIGHTISGVSSGVTNIFNGLLKGPLQMILNILIVAFILFGLIFIVWKFGPTIKNKIKDRQSKISKRFKRKHGKESQLKDQYEEIELTEVKTTSPINKEEESKESKRRGSKSQDCDLEYKSHFSSVLA